MCHSCSSAANVVAQHTRPAHPSEHISRERDIVSFLHCKQCLRDMPNGMSPREWARNEVGLTPDGIQVWCTRHEKNVVHIGFEGHQLPVVS